MIKTLFRYKIHYLFLALSIELVALILQIIIAIMAKGADLPLFLKLSSFFTINSNILLLICYFMILAFNSRFWSSSSTQTALLTYISFVSVVYRIMLHASWNPQGLQWWVGELLHWVNPIIYLVFWIFYVNKENLEYKQIAGWLIFPACYFTWVLLLGSLGFGYPYPFLNVEKMGIFSVMMIAIVLLLVLTMISGFFILIGKNLQFLHVDKTASAQNNSY